MILAFPNVASDFMLSFLDAFALSKASLIGNSMGGLIALYTALKIPERIDKLILQVCRKFFGVLKL